MEVRRLPVTINMVEHHNLNKKDVYRQSQGGIHD